MTGLAGDDPAPVRAEPLGRAGATPRLRGGSPGRPRRERDPGLEGRRGDPGTPAGWAAFPAPCGPEAHPGPAETPARPASAPPRVEPRHGRWPCASRSRARPLQPQRDSGTGGARGGFGFRRAGRQPRGRVEDAPGRHLGTWGGGSRGWRHTLERAGAFTKAFIRAGSPAAASVPHFTASGKCREQLPARPTGPSCPWMVDKGVSRLTSEEDFPTIPQTGLPVLGRAGLPARSEPGAHLPRGKLV